MLFKSALVTQVSGSIGGMTGSHNKGGMYFRGRTIPTNPNSSQQQAVRSIVADLSNRWPNILTPSERAAWDIYAENVPLTGPLGEPRQVSGLNMYVRSNTPRIQAGLTRIDAAPSIFDLGEYTAPTLGTIAPATNEIDIAFTAADAWDDEDGSALLVFVSPPQNPSINYYKSAFRFAGSIDGDSVTPPTSPATLTTPFAFVSGQRLFVRCNVTRADGRLGSPVFLQGDAP